MLQAARFKYLLVIVSQLIVWPEAFPTISATTGVVIKVFLGQIIPRYRIMGATDSDRGTHFTGKTLQGVMTALGKQCNLHIPWHPLSSGQVKRMNGEIKKH